MIILCILILALLGEKALRISDKIKAVQEADQLYLAGELIAAEGKYREAAANTSIQYNEEEVTERLEKLAPITAIRNGLNTLVLASRAQAATKDFTGLMESYASLVLLKAQYMKPGDPYEAYYRQLSSDSGISDQMTSYFHQFKKQFYEEMELSQNTMESTEDSFKWKLLLIPDVYYGGTGQKQQQLQARFQTHDTKKLSALAAAGQLEAFLNSATFLLNDYRSHSYSAEWVLDLTERSGMQILAKDVEAENISAFTSHALLYRKFTEDADITSSKVLTYINNSTGKLLKSAGRMARAGQYAQAIQWYDELNPLKDTSAEIAAVRLSWNIAEPVRLLPGGEEPNRYSHVISGKSRYGSKVYVCATDTAGRLYYAAIQNDESVVTVTGEMIPGYEQLRKLTFNVALSNASGTPVVLAEKENERRRTDFTAYELRPEGISLLFSLIGDRYELQPDGSIIVDNADIGDGIANQTAVYRKTDGVYQFVEIMQEEYSLIPASELELHPYENVSISGRIMLDTNGRAVAYSDGRYISLWGEARVTGDIVTLISGQFQHGYETVELVDEGEQYVPVFMVASVASLSFQLP